jgi:hypothetical protein
MSASWISSSASRGCRGKERGFVLQVLMAQVRKLRVRSFILAVKDRRGLTVGCCGCEKLDVCLWRVWRAWRVGLVACDATQILVMRDGWGGR